MTHLWDMTKFFDHVDLGILGSEAIALSALGATFNMAVHMHMACRYITCNSIVAEPICPTRSVLPGCVFATPLVRTYLRRYIQAVVTNTIHSRTHTFL